MDEIRAPFLKVFYQNKAKIKLNIGSVKSIGDAKNRKESYVPPRRSSSQKCAISGLSLNA